MKFKTIAFILVLIIFLVSPSNSFALTKDEAETEYTEFRTALIHPFVSLAGDNHAEKIPETHTKASRLCFKKLDVAEPKGK